MKIGIVGCVGRMGRMLINAIDQTPDAELAGGTERAGSPAVGEDPAMVAGLSASGLIIGDDPRALFEIADAVVDFTAPEATAAHAKLALETGTALVPGTTGLSAQQQAAIDAAAEKVAVVQAANYSVGVNLLLGLTEQAAAILGDDYDIEILEMHHRHKVDAPSGTALAAMPAPSVPPAPPRLSITRLLPAMRVNCAAMGRANASVPPPAGNGTIMVTGLLGQVDWAYAPAP